MFVIYRTVKKKYTRRRRDKIRRKIDTGKDRKKCMESGGPAGTGQFCRTFF